MSATNVVIVESPSKAKTIRKFLGPEYGVLASYGHIRDLPARPGSVRPQDDFAMDWQLNESKYADKIIESASQASQIYLATDPDREGEAIAWHLSELLAQHLPSSSSRIRRITFNEIAKKAIQQAIEHPRAVDRNLVEAYFARRALDYLVGFTLSPVLWHKVPGSRSAGRVQSVALRLVCDRESEIRLFQSRESWSIEVDFQTVRGELIRAELCQVDGKKLEKFAIGDQAAALALVSRLKTLSFVVTSLSSKPVGRHPPAPFITSTLQQEALNKLKLSPSRSMQLAQKLYEGVSVGDETVGLITYMRTDSTHLSDEACGSAREVIAQHYGRDYLPDKPRRYKSKVKNAQEAHEAIRPVDFARHPDQLESLLDRDTLRLYALIWQRAVACQMSSARFEQIRVEIASRDQPQSMGLGTGCSVLEFDGFLRVYRPTQTVAGAAGEDVGGDYGDAKHLGGVLAGLCQGEPLTRQDIHPQQHFTQPAPRFTEASLIKQLEEFGIGRPSTYASIVQVIQARSYVRLEKGRLIPQDRGIICNAFLLSFFQRYVEYGFTAALEDKLDEISNGAREWKVVLREFWQDFSPAVKQADELDHEVVAQALERVLSPYLPWPSGVKSGPDLGSPTQTIPDLSDNPADRKPEDQLPEIDPRLCPACHQGRLGLRLGRAGAFMGCSGYPKCRYTAPMALLDKSLSRPEIELPRHLGLDPDTGKAVSVRYGPFGPYLQLEPELAASVGGKGKSRVRKGSSAKRVSLPAGVDLSSIDLDTALQFLRLPRPLGLDPVSEQTVTAGVGRRGCYICCGDRYLGLTAHDDVLTVGLERALWLLSGAEQSAGAASSQKGKVLGCHPQDGQSVTVGHGRFGPYVRHRKVYASLPKDRSIDSVTLEEALGWLAQKQERKWQTKSKRGGSPATRKGGHAARKFGTSRPERASSVLLDKQLPPAR